jgi:hypothetical protein
MDHHWSNTRRGWTDENAAQFIRANLSKRPSAVRAKWNLDMLPVCAETGCPLALDSAPAALQIPTLDPATSWMTVTQPDAAAMDEASRCADFFAGVPHEVGRRRLDEYAAQREISNAGK